MIDCILGKGSIPHNKFMVLSQNGAPVAVLLQLAVTRARVRTNHPLRKPPKDVPNDMKRVFDLIDGAKQAVLFLAFDPSNNSILDAAGKALAKNPDLFVRGALTSAQRKFVQSWSVRGIIK